MNKKFLFIKPQKNSDSDNLPETVMADVWEQTVFGDDMPRYLSELLQMLIPAYLAALDDPSIQGYWISLHKDNSFTVYLDRGLGRPKKDHQPQIFNGKENNNETD